MKKRIVVGLVLLFVCAGFIAHLRISRMVEQALRERVLPELREILQADVSVGGISVACLRGALHLRDLRIGNPQSFLETNFLFASSCDIMFDLKPLFQGRFSEIRKLRMRGVELTLVRNADGMFNATRFASIRGTGRRRAAAAVSGLHEAEAHSTGLPGFLLRSGRIDGCLRLLDHSVSNMPEARLDIGVVISDLSTRRDAADTTGRIVVEACKAGNPDAFNILLRVAAPPIEDINRPTFDVVGDFGAIPAGLLSVYAGITDLDGGVLSGSFQLECKAGELVAEQSRVKAILEQPRLSAQARARFGLETDPSSFRLTIPVANSIWAPQMDIEQAWKQAFSGENLRALLEATGASKTNTSDFIRNIFERK